MACFVFVGFVDAVSFFTDVAVVVDVVVVDVMAAIVVSAAIVDFCTFSKSNFSKLNGSKKQIEVYWLKIRHS